jgi:hypothetical protein
MWKYLGVFAFVSCVAFSQANHGRSNEFENRFSIDSTFSEYLKEISEAQNSSAKSKSENKTDKFSAIQEGIVDQFIHCSVQSLGCENFKDSILFNGARLASLRLKNEGNIILGNPKDCGLLSRLSYNVETWCRINQKLDKNSYERCVKIAFSELKDLSEYFFSFSQKNSELDTNENITIEIVNETFEECTCDKNDPTIQHGPLCPGAPRPDLSNNEIPISSPDLSNNEIPISTKIPSLIFIIPYRDRENQMLLFKDMLKVDPRFRLSIDQVLTVLYSMRIGV